MLAAQFAGPHRPANVQTLSRRLNSLVGLNRCNCNIIVSDDAQATVSQSVDDSHGQTLLSNFGDQWSWQSTMFGQPVVRTPS